MDNDKIDKNLKLIYESKRDYTLYLDFVNVKINPQKKILAEEMHNKGLIMLRGEFCYKTDFGKEVIDKGGWIEYLNIKKKEKENKIKQENERQRLKDEIDRLTLINLELRNKQLKRYIVYSVISFVLGILATNAKDIITILKTQILK